MFVGFEHWMEALHEYLTACWIINMVKWMTGSFVTSAQLAM